MEYFKVVSHAAMIVASGDKKILFDPWIKGSCYWQSWWNFPDAEITSEEIESVTDVIITHVHWDHWHGHSIKQHFLNKRFHIPKTPNRRSYEDLKSIKVKDIKEINHGKSITIGDIKITCYQFGLDLVDSCFVIETPNMRILNLNDCKVSGYLLKSIISKHKKIDYCLRSHSTANPRLCISLKGDNLVDSENHYIESFINCMRVVKPKYAIPFASNHIHLKDELLPFNNFITTPLEVEKHCRNEEFKVKVMPAGSSFIQDIGFDIENIDTLINREESIRKLALKYKSIIEKYSNKEKSITITDKILHRHINQIGESLTFLDRLLKRVPKKFGLSIDGKSFFSINYYDKSYKKIELSEFENIKTRANFPSIVFKDCVNKRMYHHGFISKRVNFISNCVNADKSILRLINIMENVEMSFKNGYLFNIRFLISYISRWRELIVYFEFVILLIKSTKFYDLEKKLNQKYSK